MKADIAIVLVNYRNPEDTMLCLDSLAASAKEAGSSAVAIILVENGSGDNSVPILRRHGQALGPDFVLLESQSNLGFSGGCNLGIRHALEAGHADVLLLNNDTIVPPDFIASLRTARAANPGAIISGGLLDPVSGKPGFSVGNISSRSLIVLHLLSLPPGPYAKIGFASGGLLLAPAEVFRTVGGLRDEFFMYCEDLDFCFRLRDHGIPIIYASAVRAWHKEGSSSLKTGLPRVYYGFRNQTRLVWERGNGVNRLFYFLFLITQIKGLLRRPYITGQFLRGIRDGIHGRLGKLES